MGGTRCKKRRGSYPQVVLASPCSGHGFKFASVVGEILADLAADGETLHATSMFRLDRLTCRPGQFLRRAAQTETGSSP